MKRTLMTIVALAMIVSMTFSSCAAPQSAPTSQTSEAPESTSAPKTFKLGVVADLTGPAARTGVEQKQAIQMAFDEVGNKIGDYNVELVWVDTQADAAKAATAYEIAITRDGIQAGLNDFYSSVALAIMDIAAKYKVPHFFGSGASGEIVKKVRSDPQKYGYWMGKTWPVPEAVVVPGYVAALNEVITDPAKRRIAVVSDDGEGPTNERIAVRDGFKAAGWEVVDEEHFSTTETEFYPLLSKIKNTNPEVTYVTVSAAPSFAAFVKQSREVKLPGLLIANGLGWVGEWYSMTGDASDYVLDMIPQFTGAKATDFVQRYKQRWNEDPSPSSAGLAYDYAKFFIKVANRAIEEYGELTSDALYQVGNKEMWTGQLTFTDGIMMKEYKYSQESYPDAVVGPDAFTFPVIQYFGGQTKVVWPADKADSQLQLPPQ